MPQRYPRLTCRQSLRNCARFAIRIWRSRILSRFITDIAPDDLRGIIARTYTAATFGSDDITPLATLEPGLHLLHLSNGPTLAFKDVALQLLGNLFEHVLRDGDRTLNILGATSGDTGSSAEYAMRGKRDIAVFMLSPHGRMSAFQQAQMYALDDAEHPQPRDRRHVRRLPGHRQGDRGRRGVQARALARRGQLDQLGARSPRRSSITSRATSPRRRAIRSRSSFAVPSGNFGNVLAGHVARRMGLPIRATDPRDERERRARRILPHRPLPAARLRQRRTRRRRRRWTSRRASNFERFMFDIAGRDPAELRRLWQRLERDRRIRHRRHADVGARPRVRFRFRPQHARRPHRDDPRRARPVRSADRPAYG